MFTDFDFSVILTNLPYLFFDGMRFTVFSQAAYCSDVTLEER